MLRLNKSNDTQTIAIHLSTTESITSLAFNYSQDYDLSSGSFSGAVEATKGNYQIVTISGSVMPDFSGFYTLNVLDNTPVVYVWQTANVVWSSANFTWEDGGAGKGTQLRTIRAFVSGSNDTAFTNYQSPNESGSYTTYNG